MNMPGLITIHLNELRFFAYHGLYPEERKTGNEFQLDIELTYLSQDTVIGDISETVNYAAVYDLARQIMQQPESLLETLAMRIADAIHDNFPVVRSAGVTIKKLHPPIPRFTGNVAVSYFREY